jgi:hypothetical protein
MRHLFYVFCLLTFCSVWAQSPKTPLLEEFTGENCPPCAATNPGLDKLLLGKTNTGKINFIKWQVPIPSAPTKTFSLYQTNKTEINYRYQGSPSGYGYQSKYTSNTAASSGINAAPTGLIDGRHLWEFGAGSDHPSDINNGVIATAASYTSAFMISLAREWDLTFSTITVTASILSTANYTATGNLKFRLVMVEREVLFSAAPGTNGEKEFHNAVRRSFPNLPTATTLAPVWISGQQQTFTISCPLPSSILNKEEIAFIGFIQDDGNKRIEQSKMSDTQGTTDDAKALSIEVPSLICSGATTASVSIQNHGSTIISSLTVNITLDGNSQTSIPFSGTLAPGNSTLFTYGLNSLSSGGHILSFTITNVNGGIDTYPANNSAEFFFVKSAVPASVPIVEAFTPTVDIPAGWSLYNEDKGTETWVHSDVGAFGKGAGSMLYRFVSNSTISDVDDLLLPAMDLSTIPSPSLSFDLAHAPYPGGYNDSLEILASTDCGSSWTKIYNKSSATMSTAVETTAEFIPDAQEWRTEIVDLTQFFGSSPFFLMFRAINANGNNLYIDNVNISNTPNTTFLDELNPGNLDVQLYPNPAQRITFIEIKDQNKDFKARLFDPLGKEMFPDITKRGDDLQVIDVTSMPTGVYFVKLTGGGNTRNLKLVVAR